MDDGKSATTNGGQAFDPTKVDELLGTGGGLLGELADLAAERWVSKEAERWLDARVGPYRITEYLDRGGMSLVFRAERCDGQFEQQVAIKVLRTPDAAEMAQRFERERQLLARLEHPGIAHIIDSGVADGRPWIAMELVDGAPIDEYCDRHQLGLDQRLEVFVRVARTVQFAHGRLVVHRDLKPNNILVNVEGQPKLLDFGIAKALQGDFEVELTGPTMLLTPLYASPEQVLGTPVGVASDIYQLGLLLYRLLTGCDAQAMDRGSVAEIKAVVVDDEPLSPSLQIDTTGRQDTGRAERIALTRSTSPARLRKRLSGDLDAIVLRALEKEPERRYATVEQLIADVENYRACRPIVARPATGWYRVARFTQRHRGSVAAGVLTFLVISGSLVAAGLSWRGTIAAQQVALVEAQRAEQVADFLTGMIEQADPWIGGGRERATTKGLLDANIAGIEALTDQPEVQATLRRAFGKAYHSMGEYPTSINLTQQALEQWRQIGNQNEVVQALSNLSQTYSVLDQVDQAEANATEALRIASSDPTVDPLSKARALHVSSIVRNLRGDSAGQKSLLLQIESIVNGREDHESIRLRIAAYTRLIQHAESTYDIAGAQRYSNQVWQLIDDSPSNWATRSLLLAHDGWLHSLLGNQPRALEFYRQSLDQTRLIFGDDHFRTASAAALLGSALMQMDRLTEAEPALQTSLANLETSLGSDHWAYMEVTLFRSELVHKSGSFERARVLLQAALKQAKPGWATEIGGLYQARLLFNEQRYGQALPLLEAKLASARRELHVHNPDVHLAAINHAQTLLALGEIDRAATLLTQLLAKGQEIWAEGFPGLQQTHLALAQVAYLRGDVGQALDHVDKALDMAQVMDGGTFQSLFDAMSLRARILSATGSAQAKGAAERAWSMDDSNLANESVYRQRALAGFALTLARLGEHDRAGQLCESASAAIGKAVAIDHPFMAYTLADCGEVSLLAGRHVQARTQLQQSLNVLSGQLPEAHWRLAWLSGMLALSQDDGAREAVVSLERELSAALARDSLVVKQLARQTPMLIQPPSR